MKTYQLTFPKNRIISKLAPAFCGGIAESLEKIGDKLLKTEQPDAANYYRLAAEWYETGQACCLGHGRANAMRVEARRCLDLAAQCLKDMPSTF